MQTKAFRGADGKLTALVAHRVEPRDGKFVDVPGSEFEIKADLVLLAMGYVHPVHRGLLDTLGVKYDARGNVAADTESYRTSLSKVFAAGDTDVSSVRSALNVDETHEDRPFPGDAASKLAG